MRNLLISSKYPPEYSGSGLRAHRTYQRLRDRFDIDFDVLTSSVTHNTSTTYAFEGIKVKRIADKRNTVFHRNRDLAGVKKIYQAFNYRWAWHSNYWPEAMATFRFLQRSEKHYDLFHVFGNAAVTAAAITYAKIKNKPLVVELVNWSESPGHYESGFVSRLWGRGYPDHALIVCLSDQLRKACIKLGYPESQIWCRPNPIDERRFTPEGPTANRNPFSDRDIVILHLAKFIPRKKQDFMIGVLAKLPERYKLILAGPLAQSGPLKTRDHQYLEKTVKAARAAGVAQRLHIVPEFIEHPQEYMRMADVFVLPSVDEAFGTPFLESIACGTPAIVNKLPDVYDRWIQPGQNGFICELEPKLWAQRIQDAAKISRETRQQAAEGILQTASTRVIDHQYHTRFAALCENAILRK